MGHAGAIVSGSRGHRRGQGRGARGQGRAGRPDPDPGRRARRVAARRRGLARVSSRRSSAAPPAPSTAHSRASRVNAGRRLWRDSDSLAGRPCRALIGPSDSTSCRSPRQPCAPALVVTTAKPSLEHLARWTACCARSRRSWPERDPAPALEARRRRPRQRRSSRRRRHEPASAPAPRPLPAARRARRPPARPHRRPLDPRAARRGRRGWRSSTRLLARASSLRRL